MKQDTDAICLLCHIEDEDAPHFIHGCLKIPMEINRKVEDIQSIYVEEGCRPPTPPNEICSAVLNGWGYMPQGVSARVY